MFDSFQEKKPLYPLLGLGVTLFTLIGGLALARSAAGIVFLIGVWLLLFLFGYRRTCLKMLPVLIIYMLAVFALFYLAGQGNAVFAGQMTIRLTGVLLAVIPGLAMEPVRLVRALTGLKCPRLLTLGMLITTSFIPVLAGEIRQVRNAMRTRGITSFWNLTVLYRAFLIPLIVRLVNISDTLALSVETRGFISDSGDYTIYHPEKMKPTDIAFLALYCVLLFGCLAYALLT